MSALPDSEFRTVWDAAGSVAAAVSAVSEGAARPVPRWVVLARAKSLRQAGVPLREYADERPQVSVLIKAKELATALMAQHGLTGWQFGFRTTGQNRSG